MARGPRVGRSTGFTVRNVNIPDVVLYMFDMTVIAACKSLLSDAKYRSLECYFTSLVLILNKTVKFFRGVPMKKASATELTFTGWNLLKP